jgi:hypothetical protein
VVFRAPYAKWVHYRTRARKQSTKYRNAGTKRWKKIRGEVTGAVTHKNGGAFFLRDAMNAARNGMVQRVAGAARVG